MYGLHTFSVILLGDNPIERENGREKIKFILAIEYVTGTLMPWIC